MKRYIKLLYLCVAMLSVACTSDMEYNPGGVGSVGTLFAPNNGYYVELMSGEGNDVSFTWLGTSAEDGCDPLYEVVFYSDASASKELTRIPAGNKTTLNVTHKELNSVMNVAGVEPNTEGTVYWSVVASRGYADAPAKPQAREMTIKRLQGFKITPEFLYLVGSATETGADIASARIFSTIASGEEYEIFTTLTSGEYNITDGNSGNARYFNVSGGVISEDNSDPIVNVDEGVYRINVDLTSSSVTIDKVENFRLKMCSDGAETAVPYIGSGVWRIEGAATKFANPWQDDRYYFRADIGGVSTVIGSKNWDNGTPASSDSVTWETQLHISNDNWGYSYKVIGEYRGQDGMKMDVEVRLNADQPGYSHTAYFTEL